MEVTPETDFIELLENLIDYLVMDLGSQFEKAKEASSLRNRCIVALRELESF